MMSKHTFSQEDYYTYEVQPELDRISTRFAQSWWMVKSVFFLLLYILGTVLYGVFHFGTAAVSILLSIASFVDGVFRGLKLLCKIGLDWLRSRPELQQWNVR